MEFHLDREIRFAQEPEYKNLFSWFLQEFARDGTAVGPKFIPWTWSINFIASDMRYVQRIELNNFANKEDYAYEYIEVNLRHEEQIRFSFFGTDREIKKFSLMIRSLGDSRAEANNGLAVHCSSWGIISFTSEVDFEYHSQDDMVGFNLLIASTDFNKLCELARRRVVGDSLLFRVDGVSGFYAEWSPAVRTRAIKVLAQGKEHHVVKPEGQELPALRSVSEFSLSFARAGALVPWATIRVDVPPRESDVKISDSGPSDKSEELRIQMSRLEALLKALQMPLWIIVLILIFSIILHK
jgi:hypothetical protein